VEIVENGGDGEEVDTMSLRYSITDIGFKALGTTHRVVLGLSRGKFLKTGFGMPFVELHTIGRKSGQPRVTVLTSPIHDERRVVLVASKGGDDRDPQWYRNLMVNPDVEIHIEGQVRRLRARTASAQEKAEIWPQILSVYRGYGSYQKRTGRDIPVVICEPRPV
jgi:deazaflavin-dependent oxidoreductase (nitroreductase family)